MASLGPIPPRALRRVLELDGFSIAHEDAYNWALAKDGVEDVVIIPKHGRVVAEAVLLRVVAATPRRPMPCLFSRPPDAPAGQPRPTAS